MTHWLEPEDLDEMRDHWEFGWPSEYLGGWCSGPVVVSRNPGGKRHLVPCSLDDHHEGECEPAARAFLDHNCKVNGCTDPVLIALYMEDES